MRDIGRITGEIASGNSEAFARLYRARFNFIYRFARTMTALDESVCLDIVQDTMIRVIHRMKRFDDVESLDRWLVCVTRSVALDHLRRERRRRFREAEAVRRLGLTVTDADARERADQLARLDWVRSELRGLDRLAAQIVEWRFRAGLTLGAIGTRLGMSPGAVHGRLTRAVNKIRSRAGELRDE